MGRDERELPLIVEAMRLWEAMQGLVGADVGFRRSGILYLVAGEAKAEAVRRAFADSRARTPRRASSAAEPTIALLDGAAASLL